MKVLNNRKVKIMSHGKFIALILTALLLTCLSACGKTNITLSTEMTISDQGKGARIMRLTMNRADFKKAFKGVSADGLSDEISADCPAAMEYAFSDDGKKYSFTFTIPFDSIEDYEKKTSQAAGEKAVIIYEKPESVFANGFHYQENFSTRDLIGWIDGPAASLTEGGGVFSAFISKESWNLTFNEDQKFSGETGPIEVNTLIETPVERIDILSLYHQNQTISRSVILSFSKDSMDKNGSQIKKHLEGLVPEGAVLTWTQSGDLSNCEIRQNYMSTEETSEFMKKILESDSYLKDSAYDNKQIFSYDTQRVEKLDFNSFVYETNPNISVGYYVQWENGMTASLIRKGDSKPLKLEKSDKYGAYYQALDTNSTGFELTTELTASYVVGLIEVDTDLKDEDTVKRKVSIVFELPPSESERERIRKSIADKAGAYAEVALDLEREDDKLAITVDQTGSIEAINDGFYAVFGSRGQMTHQSNGKLLSFQHDGTFSDVVDFSKFINNEVNQTTLVYKLKLQSGESISKSSICSTISLNNGPEEIKSNRYSGSIAGTFLSLTMDTRVWNSDGIMLFVLIFGFIMIVLFVLFFAKFLSMSIAKKGEEGEDNQSSVGTRVKNNLSNGLNGIRDKTRKRQTKTIKEKGRKKKVRNSLFVTEETTSFSDDMDDMDEDYTEESAGYADDPQDDAGRRFSSQEDESGDYTDSDDPADVYVGDSYVEDTDSYDPYHSYEISDEDSYDRDDRGEAGKTSAQDSDDEEDNSPKSIEDEVETMTGTSFGFDFDDL